MRTPRNVLVLVVVATVIPAAGCFGRRAGGRSRKRRVVDIERAEVVPRIIRDTTVAFVDRKFGPPLPRRAEKYRLRTGDDIEVGVWGEEMTKRLTVGPDGRISYFLATEVMASRRTLSELRGEIREILKKHFKKPEVFVSLIESAGNFVAVTGVVKTPGTYKINNETRLIAAIAMAGGVPLGSSRYGADFAEVADFSQAFVIRGDKFLDVDFEVLFGGRRDNDPRRIAANNVLLEANDRIYIPPAVKLENKVFVIGAVRVPKVINFSKSISFLEALTRAGDVPNSAWERKSFIIRGRMNNPKIIPVNARDVRTAKRPDIRLHPGDVIFVPKTPLAKVTEVIRQLDTIFTGVTHAEAASNARMFDRH